MEFFIKIKNKNINVKLTTILKITQKLKKKQRNKQKKKQLDSCIVSNYLLQDIYELQEED